jgi:glycosyltransferase involved in cell wall biosynthesis
MGPAPGPRHLMAAHVAAVVPCKDEADRIGATVRAVRGLSQVGRVVVVDDGSTDGTAERAREAGADVVSHPHNLGKAAALETGVERVRDLERLEAAQREDAPDVARSAPLLFVDGDLAGTAANLGVLTEPVLAGETEMAIATLPAQITAGGGRGLVVRLARTGIERLTGFRPVQPLSGMRCLTPSAYEAAVPLADGWGVETALTVDVLRAGLRVTEVPCDLQHRVSGRDWRGQVHRAEQYRDVWRALLRRGWRPWQRG